MVNSNSDNLIRLFIGIKIQLTGESHELFSLIKQKLNDSLINWVPLDNLHVTIKFIGEKPVFHLNTIDTIIAESVKNIQEFELEFNSIGVFGKQNPTTLWMGLKENNSLNKLVYNIETSLLDFGIIKEVQPFTPHLTLGRIKRLYNAAELKDIIEKYKQVEIQRTKISGVQLFESVLLAKGPVYKVISEQQLQKPEDC